MTVVSDVTDDASRLPEPDRSGWPGGPAPQQKTDQVAPFRPAILGIRGGTTAVSVALASPAFTEGDLWVVGWCFLIVGYNVFRIVRPVRYVDDTRSLVRVIGEVAFHTIAVAATGYWDSPFIFALITAVMVAGFARGFAFALRVSIAACLAIAIPFLVQDGTTVEDVRTTAQWTVELVLVALIAGYARRVTGEADRAHSLALDRLGRLADANTLLYSLHRVAQSLPASLDLEEVLDTTMGRLRDLFTFDGATVLLLDETDESWVVMRWDGPRPAPSYQTHELPGPLREALAVRHPVMVSELLHEGGGMSAEMVSGLYAALPAREATVGLVALEHRDLSHFELRDMELLNGFVEPAALAVDNARWFARLRTVGADEERTRIARDLHDRIGQSLAYLAFERLPRALPANATVRYVPLLFAGLLRHWGNVGPAEIAPKRRFTFEHVAWIAHRDGIRLAMPAVHPFNPLPLLRLAVALELEGRLTHATLAPVWSVRSLGYGRLRCEVFWQHASSSWAVVLLGAAPGVIGRAACGYGDVLQTAGVTAGAGDVAPPNAGIDGAPV